MVPKLNWGPRKRRRFDFETWWKNAMIRDVTDSVSAKRNQRLLMFAGKKGKKQGIKFLFTLKKEDSLTDWTEMFLDPPHRNVDKTLSKDARPLKIVLNVAKSLFLISQSISPHVWKSIGNC